MSPMNLILASGSPRRRELLSLYTTDFTVCVSDFDVHTGVCISDGTRTESFVDSCRVTFFPLSGEEIDFYASTAEPYDKAGAYAIQGRAALWLDRIEGDYYTIMGLPVSRTVQLLAHFM